MNYINILCFILCPINYCMIVFPWEHQRLVRVSGFIFSVELVNMKFEQQNLRWTSAKPCRERICGAKGGGQSPAGQLTGLSGIQ